MAVLSLSLSLSLYLAAHPVHEILSWHENRRNDNGVGIKNTLSKMLDIILLHTNQAKIFGISEKPLHAGKEEEEEEESPKKMVHLPFSTIYFDLWPRLKDSFLKDGIGIRIWSCLKNAQRQRSTKNTKGFFLPILELGLNLFYLLQISNVFLLCPALDVFPGNWR